MNRGISLISPERRRACLLLHGLAASPWEMSDLARTLDLYGWNISEPLLLNLHDFEKNGFRTLSPDDWIKPAQKALDNLISGHDRVVLIGSSLGAILAAKVLVRSLCYDHLYSSCLPFNAYGQNSI